MGCVLNPHMVAPLLVFVILPACSFEGHHQVVGPSQPIVATVGDDIILPCRLEPAVDVSSKTAEWTRPGLKPRFVYVWRDGGELESKKDPSYRGRTSAFIDKLEHGDVSVSLSRVKLSDEGRYRCFIPAVRRDAVMELIVASVSSPFIVSIDGTSSGLVLQCESKGWHPEPEMLWLDGEGNLLPAGPTETVRGPDDLYTVSSRVTVEKRHSNNFTCRVQQKNINQTRATHIHISADFFTVLPSSADCIIIGVVALVIFLLCSLTVTFVWWRWIQKKSRQNQKVQPLMELERATPSGKRGKDQST